MPTMCFIYSRRHTMCPEMCQAPFPTSPHHLFKRRRRLLVSTADKNNVVHMPFAGMWHRLRVSCHPNIFQRVVSLAWCFFNTKITAAVPARTFRLSFASRLKLEQQWNSGFICSIKQKCPFIWNSHVWLINIICFGFFFPLDDHGC